MRVETEERLGVGVGDVLAIVIVGQRPQELGDLTRLEAVEGVVAK